MATARPDDDEITLRLRAEEAALRRRTALLTLVPIVVGVAVVLVAASSLRRLEARKDLLQDEALELRAHTERLQGQEQKLREEIAKLDVELADKRALFQRVEEQLPQATRHEVTLINDGLELSRKGDYDAAIRSFDQALSLDAENAMVYNWRGYASYREGELDTAQASLSQALELDPENAQAHYNLGLVLWERGERDAAVQQTEAAFAQDSSYRTIAYGDPQYRPIRDYKDGLSATESASGEEEKKLIERGLELAKAGRFERAIEWYSRALEQNPENALVANWRGYAYYRLKRYDEAIASLEQAVAADPDYAEAYYNLALALWQAGRREDAVAATRKAFAADPSYRQAAQQDPQFRPIARFLRDLGTG